MQKTISAFEARRKFGKVLDDVVAQRDEVLVERHGKPVAVVVPVALYESFQEQREASRDELFRSIEQAGKNANLSPEEADQVALEAVFADRLDRRLDADGFYALLMQARDGADCNSSDASSYFDEAVELLRRRVFLRQPAPAR
jgi:prevent-host-death family protein